jgi:hypothetical protein
MLPKLPIHGAYTTSYKDRTLFVVCIAALLQENPEFESAYRCLATLMFESRRIKKFFRRPG